MTHNELIAFLNGALFGLVVGFMIFFSLGKSMAPGVTPQQWEIAKQSCVEIEYVWSDNYRCKTIGVKK